MKTIITSLLLLITITTTAQYKFTTGRDINYFYATASTQPLTLFMDTHDEYNNKDVQGLALDLEVGVRYKSIGASISAGYFDNLNFSNYSANVDYYIPINRTLETSIGVGYGLVLTRYKTGMNLDRRGWSGPDSYNIRGQFLINITDNFTITTGGRFRHRLDLAQYGSFELLTGITYKLNI